MLLLHCSYQGYNANKIPNTDRSSTTVASLRRSHSRYGVKRYALQATLANLNQQNPAIQFRGSERARERERERERGGGGGGETLGGPGGNRDVRSLARDFVGFQRSASRIQDFPTCITTVARAGQGVGMCYFVTVPSNRTSANESFSADLMLLSSFFFRSPTLSASTKRKQIASAFPSHDAPLKRNEKEIRSCNFVAPPNATSPRRRNVHQR